jgi:hypothetical protein
MNLQEMCDQANRKCYEWEQGRFDLGSSGHHYGMLQSFADPELLEARKRGEVVIYMPSEYHAPRFMTKANFDKENGR